MWFLLFAICVGRVWADESMCLVTSSYGTRVITSPINLQSLTYNSTNPNQPAITTYITMDQNQLYLFIIPNTRAQSQAGSFNLTVRNGEGSTQYVHAQSLLSTAGCSDGTREGLANIWKYPGIAACQAKWSVPGVADVTPRCARQSGNTYPNAPSNGCSAQDACAEGWHLCSSVSEIQNRLGNGTCSDVGKGFYVSAQSGGGCAMCAVGTQTCSPVTCDPACAPGPNMRNDVFGCGDIDDGQCPETGPDRSCGPINRFSNNECCGLNQTVWRCPHDLLEANVIRKNLIDGGGVMCCSDEPRSTNAFDLKDGAVNMHWEWTAGEVFDGRAIFGPLDFSNNQNLSISIDEQFNLNSWNFMYHVFYGIDMIGSLEIPLKSPLDLWYQKCSTLLCGNGFLEPGEDCEPPNSGCCSSHCTFQPSTFKCADASSTCVDGAYCTGSDPICPCQMSTSSTESRSASSRSTYVSTSTHAALSTTSSRPPSSIFTHSSQSTSEPDRRSSHEGWSDGGIIAMTIFVTLMIVIIIGAGLIGILYLMRRRQGKPMIQPYELLSVQEPLE